MAGSATQINVRLPSDLKEQGDRGLREIGLSTTEAVRRLWAALSTRGEEFERAKAVLLGEPDVAESSGARVEGPLERGWEFVDARARELGLSTGHAVEVTASGGVPTTDDDLLAEALGERMSERGVV